MRSAPERSWLRDAPPGDRDPTLVLVAVPHAGAGAASFARWPALLGSDVRTLRVQLPGREDVVGEPPRRRVGEVVAALGPQVVRLAAGVPVALYGHSMGALVAYELARALSLAGVPPVHLAVSGRRAPHLPARGTSVHRLPDAELIAALAQMAAVHGRRPGPAPTPAQQRYALRVTRADLEVGEEYDHEPGPRLAAPVLAFAGRHDPIVDHDEVLAWRATTRGGFTTVDLPGGHFFHQEHRARLAVELRAAWGRIVPGLTTTSSAREAISGAAGSP